MRRIVHVSITNPSEDSPFAYFRGKARVEKMIRDSGLGYGIVRPSLIFVGGTTITAAWRLLTAGTRA